MPSRLASPVLSVSINDIAKVDTTNVDNLFTMWTIFSKCADSLENGRRLENLSWRLWNRETFCCEAVAEEETTSSATVPAVEVKSVRRDCDISYADMPPLSESVESITSDCANSTSSQFESRTESIHIKGARPQLIRRESSRGREKHMTPVHLAKLVDGMKTDDILTHRAQSFPPSKAQKIAATPIQTSAPQPLTMAPTQPAAAEEETHSIVRGFSPAHISSSIRSHRAQPEPKKKHMWIIGSTSSDGSSCMEVYPQQRKHASFKEEVVTRTVDDDDEYTTEEEMDESAIDDDESDWDSVSDSMSSSYEQRNMFQRVEELAQPELPSRRSLLSTLLCEPSRAATLTNTGSRSTSVLRSRTTTPQGPSAAPSPSPTSLLGGLKMTARPIIATTNVHPPALSPRTTRRNMLATELTESLRQNLIWERNQRDTTAQAVLKRRHTAHTEMSKLTEYPQLSHMPSKDTSKNNSWNHFFDGLNEYHTKGW
ncbi:DUF1752-domain-containing protein [Terfezia boudieri ATCC MYA-4762]|uniref:DUF1752-domain-containing protein n=1 Tax=Terfezia boudieri ATCC MYA-4762 TaxID=1051890 RepID=A0A3N4M2Z2_9PEZI|nr:DUF1752-domain-containing protein [Terfezia boudieri ATCC MYA-4762]